MVKHTQVKARGTSLVEALIALLIVALGLMAMTVIQGRLRHSGDAAKQRTEATRLAQAEMQRLRAYAALRRDASTPSSAAVYAELNDQLVEVDGISTRYTLQRTVQPLAQAGLEVQLNLSWRDRTLDANDAPLSLNWHTAVAATEPRLLIAAQLPPDEGLAARRLQKRHSAIPLGAKRLDADRSVFKPQELGGLALLLDNRSGEVVQRCRVQATLLTRQIRATDLLDCDTRLASGSVLLRGHVRFALGLQPDPEFANDAVLAGVGVALQLTEPAQPQAASCQTQTESDGGEQRLSYTCVIERPTSESTWRGWSGRSVLNGLRFAPGGHRVCRYSDDFDLDGRISNLEHPLDYTGVKASMAHQNFLVIAFEAPCPLGRRLDIAQQQYRNSRTVNHQPL